MKKLILGFLVIVGNLVFSGTLSALEANIEQIRKVAEKGHPVAQYKLGNSFFHGKGVAKDDTEALVWYKKAADQGYIIAQYNLGVIYQTGNGAIKDYFKALDWYFKAAENGSAGAQNKLGMMYEKGEGVAQKLAISLPASAIELSPDATNIPSDYASVKGGKVVFNNRSTAYSSITFNSILNSYGLTLAPERVAEVPPSYAKVVNDKPVFNKTHIAYAPEDYHKIFTAYGLELSSEGAATLLGAVDYCNVVNDKIRFGNSSIAYGSKEMGTILAAYGLPGAMVVEEVVVAVVEEVPVAAIVEVDCIDSDGDTVCDEIDVCGATPKGVKVDERGCWTLEQTYLFDFDKAVVKSEFFPLLDHIAKVMNDNPKMTVQLEGHTDSIGSVEYNQGLSERRANAIKDSLVKRTMVDAKRLNAVGFGENKPITTNETEAGRAKNRRVDLKPVW